MPHENQAKDHPFVIALRGMFPAAWIRETARETGFVERERKIDPVAFFWVFALGYTTRAVRSLVELKRRYENRTGKTVVDSSWYDRFTPELVAFIRAAVTRAIEHLASSPGKSLGEKLAWARDVLIQDSTVVRLHEKLAEHWPATRSRRVAAGVKVNLVVSALATGPKTVQLVGERTSESKLLKIGQWVKDRILLIDLGYYKHHAFTKIHENGGYFVTRVKESANPLIVSANTVRGNSIDVEGQRLRDVLPRLKRGVLDAVVEVSFRRRRYKGKARSDTQQFRLVAVRNDETGKYHAYLTNIDSDRLDAGDVAALYSVRWHVELVIKELKSRFALDKIDTTNPQVVEALIWSSLLSLLISRRLFVIVRSSAPPDKQPRFTTMRWTNAFLEDAPQLARLVLQAEGIEPGMMLSMEVYSSQALDPHVNRDRLGDGLIE